MEHRPTTDTLRGMVSVLCSAAMILVGAWLLVLITGMVAIFVGLLVVGLYVPLRCQTWRRDPGRGVHVRAHLR